MKEKRVKGLPMYPGSLNHYIFLSVLIMIEAGLLIAQAYFLARAITALFDGVLLLDALQFIALFFLFFLLRHLLVQGETKLAQNYSIETTEELRNTLFKNYMNNFTIAQKKGTGHLINLAMEGIDNVRLYLEIIGIRTLKSVLLPLTIVIYIFQVDRRAAVILVVTVPVIIIFMILLGLAAEKLADKQYDTYMRLSNHFIDSLKGLETLMFLGKSKSHAQNIAFVNEEYRKATMKTLRVAFLSSFALDFFSSLSIAFVAVSLGLRLIDGTVLLLPALTILILAPEYFAPIKDIGKDYHATLDGQVAMQEINKLIENKKENQKVFKIIEGPIKSIELENVSVRIDNQQILNKFNIKMNRGIIGLIGTSGAGKSTLLHLLAGRIEPSDGIFKINDEKIDRLQKTNWYEKIAYIPQHPYIFPLSLADNIRFYAPKTSDEKVEEMIEKIGLIDLVKEFPQGIDEKIGEGHRSLSGGQEQRIAMARALLSDKPIILLDEPTAHLDVMTEYEIKQLMLNIFQNKFVVIATHRLHWLDAVNEVISLEEGKVRFSGTVKEFYKREKEQQKVDQ